MTPVQLNKLAVFFKKEIDSKDFASYMRKFMYQSILNHLEQTDRNDEDMCKGYYWLTEFLETIEPQMERS